MFDFHVAFNSLEFSAEFIDWTTATELEPEL